MSVSSSVSLPSVSPSLAVVANNGVVELPLTIYRLKEGTCKASKWFNKVYADKGTDAFRIAGHMYSKRYNLTLKKHKNWQIENKIDFLKELNDYTRSLMISIEYNSVKREEAKMWDSVSSYLLNTPLETQQAAYNECFKQTIAYVNQFAEFGYKIY